MNSNLKRKLASESRAVSPPATRRKVLPLSEDDNLSVQAGSASVLNKTSFKIISWNVNGVRPLLQKPLSFDGQAKTPLRAFLSRHAWPALLCLQEVKISVKDLATQRAVHAAANADLAPGEPEYDVCFSLPRDKYNATGFGGKVHGVATLVRRDMLIQSIDPLPPNGTHSKTGRTVIKPVSWDLEGRVLVTLLPNSISARGLAVVNGYWVNGTENPYRDSVTGRLSGTRHDHKLRFHQHMLEECGHLENEGYHVVLIGDMNIAPGRIDGHPNLRTIPMQHVRNRADFNEKFLGEAGWGVDVFRVLHGDKRQYTYHPRRGEWGATCDRVDLVVVGRSMVDGGAIVDCGIEDNSHERGHSDHVPLWVSIDLDRLITTQKNEPGD